MQKIQKHKVSDNGAIFKNVKIVVVVSQYNKAITDNLLGYCKKTLAQNGVIEKNIKAISVPGALEIPVTAKRAAKKFKPHAIIALGCVIKGDTYHFEIVVDTCAYGCQKVALEFGIPVINEVLACYNVKQAKERSAKNSQNKGIEAATTALEMIRILSESIH